MLCITEPSARLRAGVKVLLAGEQQAAVTVAVEGLMDGKPLPELESFLTLDPKVISSTKAPNIWSTHAAMV